MEKAEQTMNTRDLAVFQEVFSIQEPFVYAALVKDPETQKVHYKVIEPTLLENETRLLTEIKRVLMTEIDVNLKEIATRDKAAAYLQRKIREVIKNYRFHVAEEAVDKLTYYIVRDFVYYGKIDPLMRDRMVKTYPPTA
jgi:flagellar protein FlaI